MRIVRLITATSVGIRLSHKDSHLPSPMKVKKKQISGDILVLIQILSILGI